MTRFQIVGLADCPWFALCKKLSEEINGVNPSVEFHTQMMDRFHWSEYCEKMKRQRGWDIKKSPIVYEILVDNEGKRNLIGDCNDFCDFAAMYFDIFYDPTSAALQAAALANKAQFGRGFEGQERGNQAIFNVAIINAPLKMLDLLLSQLLSPVSMVPMGVLLNIHIFDELTDSRILQGVLMEVTDLASPILFKMTISSNMTMAFYNAHLIIIAEDFSKGLTEERKDWITRVEMKATKFIVALNDHRTISFDCRIIVGGAGPQCYIAEMIRKATSFLKSGPGRVVASGQYIAQKAKCELSKIGAIPAGCIARIHAWGWPEETGAYIEVKDAVLRGADISIQGPGVEIPLTEEATNSDYIFKKFSKDFLKQQRKLLIDAVPRPKRDMALAESILSTVHIWLSSEVIAKRTSGDGREESPTDPVPIVPSKGPLPVLNVGVPCASGSTFPEGSYMVQPAVCIEGRWQALGIISEKTHKSVVQEVNKLWVEREDLIYRDRTITRLFPDFDELIGTAPIGDENYKGSDPEEEDPQQQALVITSVPTSGQEDN